MKKIHGEDSGSFFMTRFSTFQVQQAKFSTEKSMLQAQSYFFGTFLSLPQRLERFWRWAHKNLMQINKATCRVLMCRSPCPSHAEVQVGWRGDWEQPWKKDLGLLMNEKLSMTWQRAFAAQKPTWASSQEVRPAGWEKRSYYFTLETPTWSPASSRGALRAQICFSTKHCPAFQTIFEYELQSYTWNQKFKLKVSEMQAKCYLLVGNRQNVIMWRLII